MLTYCLKCKRNTENVGSKVLKIQNFCAVCSSKKSRFIKEQEVRGLLSSLGLKTQLSNIPLLDRILF